MAFAAGCATELDTSGAGTTLNVTSMTKMVQIDRTYISLACTRGAVIMAPKLQTVVACMQASRSIEAPSASNPCLAELSLPECTAAMCLKAATILRAPHADSTATLSRGCTQTATLSNAMSLMRPSVFGLLQSLGDLLPYSKPRRWLE